MKGSLVTDDAPADASEFVGEGDGGDVESTTPCDGEGPCAEIVRHVCDGAGTKGGTSSVDQHHAEVAVTSLGDAAEAARVSGGMLAGREPEVGGEVSARAEAVEVTHEGDERGRGQDANAGDAHEDCRFRHRASEMLEFDAQMIRFGLKRFDLGEQIAQGMPQEVG